MRTNERLRNSYKYRTILLLFVILIVNGCGPSIKTPSMSEMLPKFSPPSKPIANNQWLDAERVVIISHIPQTIAMAHEKPNQAAAFLGHTIFMGGLVGYFLTEPKDVSSQYQVEVAKRMPDFQKHLRTKLEEAVNSRRNKPVVSVGGPLKYRDDFVLKSSDSVLEANCLPFLATDEQGKHFLEVMLIWDLVANGLKYRELSDKLEATNADWQARRKNIHEHVAAQKQIMAQYDGEGYFFYKSPPHTREEWLGNNVELIQQEMNRGIESVVSQLVYVLFPGKRG